MSTLHFVSQGESEHGCDLQADSEADTSFEFRCIAETYGARKNALEARLIELIYA